MMSRLIKWVIISSLIFGCAAGIRAQEMVWHEGSWDQLSQKAKQSGQLIFIDFYTTWCAPCIRMDKEVFNSSEISTFYNQAFINVKLDAEDDDLGTRLAQQYAISSYPTLVFVDSNGEFVTSLIGYQNQIEMLNAGRKLVDLQKEMSWIKSASADEKRTIEELRRLLELSEIYSFDDKSKLAMSYLDSIDILSEQDLRLVMGEVSKMDIKYIERLSPLTASLSYADIALRRNPKEWNQWKTDLERKVFDLLDDTKHRNNLREYERVLEIVKQINGMKNRRVDQYYMAFYKQNDLQKYRTAAIYHIDEYIIPSRPNDIHAADEEKFQLLQAEIHKDLQFASSKLGATIEQDDQSNTPTIDSLSQIYTISKGIADQLYEISSDFFALYDDESSQRKSAFYASLAYTYFPYDWKYYDNHIFILQSLGKKEEADKVLSKARSLPWYSEMRVPRS